MPNPWSHSDSPHVGLSVFPSYNVIVGRNKKERWTYDGPAIVTQPYDDRLGFDHAASLHDINRSA